MTRPRISLAVAFAAVALLGACADDGTPGAGGTSSPTPSPTSSTFDEAEWSITTPAGWTREDVTASADAKKAIRYAGADGNYVIVHIDPTGSDFAADSVWRYQVSGDRFEVVEKTPCTAGADAQCSTNDTRFDGYLIAKSDGDTPVVGGHTWYFAFGNSTSTTIDEAFFEQILENLRVKPA